MHEKYSVIIPTSVLIAANGKTVAWINFRDIYR